MLGYYLTWVLSGSSISAIFLRNLVAATGIAPDFIVNVGVRSIREIVSGDQLAVVLQAYSNIVDTVMYLGIGTSIAASAFTWGLGCKDILVEKKLNAILSSDTEDGELPPPSAVE